MNRYNFKVVENKWQKYWEENKSFKSILNKSKKKFTRSNYGFWYHNEIKKNKSKYKPKFGDIIFYTFECERNRYSSRLWNRVAQGPSEKR